MVMDCDHMVKPDIYNKMAACMLGDMNMAVVLVPQSFFNLIMPDSFDTAGKDFTFIKMPFAFGASIIYITGARCGSLSSPTHCLLSLPPPPSPLPAPSRPLRTICSPSQVLCRNKLLHACACRL